MLPSLPSHARTFPGCATAGAVCGAAQPAAASVHDDYAARTARPLGLLRRLHGRHAGGGEQRQDCQICFPYFDLVCSVEKGVDDGRWTRCSGARIRFTAAGRMVPVLTRENHCLFVNADRV